MLKVFKQGSDRVLRGKGWFEVGPGSSETNKKAVIILQVRVMKSELG